MTDLATITRSIEEISAITKAGNVEVTKQLAEFAEAKRSLEQRVLDAEQKLSARMKGGTLQTAQGFNFGQLVANDAKLKSLRAGDINQARIIVPGSLRQICKSVLVETGTSGASPENGFPTPPEFLFATPQNAPGRRLQVLQALPHQPVGGGTVIVPQVSSSSDGSAVQEWQGGAKGESTLAVHGESLPMSTVATYINASKQLLDDVATLPTFLQNWLGFFAMRKFENLVIAGDGSDANGKISGLTTQGTPFSAGATYNSDKIGQAIFEALPSYGYAADLVIVNSTDFFGIVSQRATTEQYVSAGWNASAPNRLWGVPAISTPGMPQGTAVVLDSQLVSILDRNELTFLIGMVGSQMTENLFTYLAELRGNLAVGDPHAIAVVTLV